MAVSVCWGTLCGSLCALSLWAWRRLVFLSTLCSFIVVFVIVGQKIPERHRFPSAAMAMGDSLSSFPTSPAFSGSSGGSPAGAQMHHSYADDRSIAPGNLDDDDDRPPDRRSLASANLSPSIALFKQDLFADDVNGTAGTPRPVLVHTPEAPFNATPSPFTPDESSGWGYCCDSFYRNVVFLPNSTRLFAILEQSCTMHNVTYERQGSGENSVMVEYSNLTVTFREMSVRQADLLPVRQGRKPLADDAVLSYWWPADSTDGERVSTPIVYQEDKNMSLMATIYGMDIAKTGTHLVLGSSGYRGSMYPTPPVLTSLSTINGSRSLIMSLTGDVEVTSVDAMALDPNKTRLLVDEGFTVPSEYVTGGGGIKQDRIVSADVDESGYPVKSDGAEREGYPFHIVHRLGSPPDPKKSYFSGMVYFSPHSVTPSGRCMYLLDRSEVFGLDPSTSRLTRVLGSGIETKPLDWMTTWASPYGIAATSDGCNLFFIRQVDYASTDGIVWVKTKRPCGTAWSVEAVVRYGEPAYNSSGSDPVLRTLALQETEGRLFLYVGYTDGRLFELEINRSQLHVCSDAKPRLKSPSLSLLITFLHLLSFVMAYVLLVIAV
ncbi:hypothetical protein CBR_g48340 [Chara braunii]|uniref:Uncharacterized protein n=1 Tax=Chara braunii TaxID=69332 RepID=A0A388K485_CHABU|nr:hypothetical protein CBR_g48340 [Chara braunii]|eukprot:GBG64872.1 hypothetical protein CBR_g48340 [Chara braunii]